MLETTARPFDVRYAHNGRDGLQAMHTQRPDLVLLDLIMPGLDGFQVLEQMRQEAGLTNVPVILLSATSFTEDALTQHSSQIIIHRPDGLHPNEVLRCLQAVLGVLEPHYDERSVPTELATG
jgi:CheY-like chemotaxis protein